MKRVFVEPTLIQILFAEVSKNSFMYDLQLILLVIVYLLMIEAL